MSRLRFVVDAIGNSGATTCRVAELLCACLSARHEATVRAQVREMAALGMTVPPEMPFFFDMPPALATTATRIAVDGGRTSGEAEFVLLLHRGQVYVTCGSDHTDRALERDSIAQAKQGCPKILAPLVWPLAEIERHWDALILRSWTTVDGARSLYQEAPVSELLAPADLLEQAGVVPEPARGATVLLSGTVATLDGRLSYADRFAFELEDPVLGRVIRHAYTVRQRPGPFR